MLPTIGARSFYAAALSLPISLPAELRDIQSILNENLRHTFFRQVRQFLLFLYLFIVIN